MENININDNAESNNFKRFIQCPLCPNIPRIGLSIDEQSNVFVQTFCNSKENDIHYCYISIQTYIESLKKGLPFINKCKGCDCDLVEGLFCDKCKDNFCFDHGIFHKLSKECLEPTNRLLSYFQYNFNCVNHNYQPCIGYCAYCKKNICYKCVVNNKYCGECDKNILKANQIKVKYDENDKVIEICENCKSFANEAKESKNYEEKQCDLCGNCKSKIIKDDSKKKNQNFLVIYDKNLYKEKEIVFYKTLIGKRIIDNEKVDFIPKSKEEFKSLFYTIEMEIKSECEKNDFEEKDKYLNQFINDNKCIIEFYEYIYDNYQYLNKEGHFNEIIFDNILRFQNFEFQKFVSDATNSKKSIEEYLKTQDKKYDFKDVCINLNEIKIKDIIQCKVLKEDIHQNGKFIGLYEPQCLELITGPMKIHDENDLEKRIIGKYTWNTGDYYIGLFDDNNYFSKFGEYHFYLGNEKYNIYIGEFKNGLLNGKGVYLSQDSHELYYGDWVNDKRQGYGIYCWSDGYIYEGKFDNDKKNDINGFIYDSKFNYQDNTLNDNEMKRLGIYNDFYYYHGEFKNDYRAGKGTIVYKNHKKYIGNFELCQRNGKGKLFNDGLTKDEIKKIKEVEWKDNELVTRTSIDLLK